MEYDKKLFETCSLYRFFTIEIKKLDSKIRQVSAKNAEFVKDQTALKRGKAELVRLRRELLERYNIKKEKT